MNSVTLLVKKRKCVYFVRVDDEGKCGGKSKKYGQDWRKSKSCGKGEEKKKSRT